MGGKLAAATIALIMVVTAAIYVGISRYQRESLLSAKEKAAAGMVRMFADSCAAPMNFDDEKAVEGAIDRLARDKDVEYAGVWKVDENGQVAAIFGQLARGATERARITPELEIVRRSDRIVLTAPVRDPNQATIGTATVAFSLAVENAAIADLRKRTLLISAGVGLCLSLLLIGLGRVLIVRPLGKLVIAAKQLESGRAGNVDIASRDEIGQLAMAFRKMGEAIRNREQRIRARNHDMRVVLDNVGQGFITLDSDGVMLDERSRVVDEWFGAPEPRMKFGAFLRRSNVKTANHFELAWTGLTDGLGLLELVLDQLPRSMAKGAMTFELNYHPIREGAELEKLIVVITDVTARVERERAERTQREMMSIFRRSLSDPHGLRAFLSEGKALVDQVCGGQLDTSAMKRAVHTLKGNSMMFGIESVASFCHELEDRMEASSSTVSAEDCAHLAGLWQATEDLVSALKLRSDRVELDPQEHRDFLSKIERKVDHGALLATAASWQYERASHRLQALAEQSRSIAQRLGKSNVRVLCEPSSLRLPPRSLDAFWAAFSHVLRNALDHGVESAEERVKLGKPATATIRLQMAVEKNQLVITVDDDGRGIDWETVAERAAARGLPHATRSDLERALFTQGVTTAPAVSAISGRGVGLAAVREVWERLGGTIEVESARGSGTTFRFRLPQAVVSEKADASVS